MSEYVFILGAGASAHTGAPLASNFLDVAERLMTSGRIEKKESFEMVFEALNELQKINHKSRIDLDNLEAVFAAFEMSELVGGIPFNVTKKEKNNSEALKEVIAETLWRSVKFPMGAGNAMLPDPVYKKFVEILSYIRSRKLRASVLTFNYDVALDYALECSQEEFDYGIATVPNDAVPFYKLHGSLNWFECNGCGSPVVIPIKEIANARLNYQVARESYGSNPAYYNVLVKPFGSNQHCSTHVLREKCVIVPPTWNKGKEHDRLKEVWSKAANELQDAQYIYICGYSMPETDAFVKYLLALGLTSKARVKSIMVFDKNIEPVGERFKRFMGVGLESRYREFQRSFEDAIDSMNYFVKQDLDR